MSNVLLWIIALAGVIAAVAILGPAMLLIPVGVFAVCLTREVARYEELSTIEGSQSPWLLARLWQDWWRRQKRRYTKWRIVTSAAVASTLRAIRTAMLVVAGATASILVIAIAVPWSSSSSTNAPISAHQFANTYSYSSYIDGVSQRVHLVRSYIRSDGTQVPAHLRTNPDSYKSNNLRPR